jgi:hypoxanthine phosphoribosyltransferase
MIGDQIVHGKEFTPLLFKTEIDKRVSILAREIAVEYDGKKPIFIGILNGSFIFASDLFKQVNIEAEITFIKLLSYKGTSSSGSVVRSLGLEESLNNRHVIIIEDIIDTGTTLHSFLPEIMDHQPASLKIATFLTKPTALKYDIKADYVGFAIEDKFVIGYGLDYDGLGRNFNNLYILKD